MSIYLDNAATSGHRKVDDAITDAMNTAMKTHWQNPSSLYASDVKEEIAECRNNIAKFINAKPDEIYFTSGASESNNWAIRGWFDNTMTSTSKVPNIITTQIEHKSIIKLVQSNVLGSYVRYCDVDEFGLIDIQSLESLLCYYKNHPILVSICMANNEIGTIQDIKKIAELVHKYKCVLHVDATQAFGHIPIDVKALDVDMMSVSGHKISPVLKGIGFLYKKECIKIHPLIYGAQENELRGGTENTFGIIGLSKAIEHCDISPKKINEMCKKRDYFIGLLERKFDCELNGDSYYRLPNNINVTFPQNITGEALLYTLDLSDIQISTGSACNSKEIKPSYVLKKIGLSNEEAMRTVRFSLSDDTAYEEIDKVIEEIEKAIKLIET